MAATPSIPTWEWTDLQNLGASGQLSGVNPIVLGAIDQAESSGQGGGVNPKGYGGWFGLGVDKTYPAGESTGTLLGETSTPRSNSRPSSPPACTIVPARRRG